MRAEAAQNRVTIRIWLAALLACAVAAGVLATLAPPLASLALLLPPCAALLWLLPEQELVPPRLLAAVFTAAIAACLCLPTYYMIQVQGLPWISLRRLALLALIALTLLQLAVWPDARAKIMSALTAAPILFALSVGFDLCAALSILASDDPVLSTQTFAEVALTWRLPFIACLLVVANETDGARIVRLIGALSLPVAALGVVDFLAARHAALDVFPQTLLAAMAEQNPGIRRLLDFYPLRNGFFRAVSIFNTPLSLGEFGAICGPLGGFLILHGARPRERALGLAVVAAALSALFVSGSRGGWAGFLIAMSLLGGAWAARLWRTHPQKNLAGPIAAFGVGLATAGALTAALTVKRLENIVFGGADALGSTAARADQAAMAWPHVLDTPLGHGLGQAAIVLDWRPAPDAAPSVDSYLISLLIETGLPGAFCYFGMIADAACACLVIYLRDRDPRAALAGPLGCALIAYGIYRMALSQRENQTLVFILLALAFVCIREARRRPCKPPRPLLER
jgi:hypothetical protein